MSNNSIAITTLAPEVQLRVNSNPDKYNPNYNDKIDPNELSTLLSDYGTNNLELLQCSNLDHRTYGEKTELNEKMWDFYVNSPTKELFAVAEGLGIPATLITFFVYPPAGLLIGGITMGAHLIHKGIAKKDAFRAMKAEQSEEANKIRQERENKEAEMQAREEALDQKELEYQQAMDEATSKINKNVKTANANAKELNEKLDKMNEKVQTITNVETEVTVEPAQTDSI